MDHHVRRRGRHGRRKNRRVILVKIGVQQDAGDAEFIELVFVFVQGREQTLGNRAGLAEVVEQAVILADTGPRPFQLSVVCLSKPRLFSHFVCRSQVIETWAGCLDRHGDETFCDSVSRSLPK